MSFGRVWLKMFGPYCFVRALMALLSIPFNKLPWSLIWSGHGFTNCKNFHTNKFFFREVYIRDSYFDSQYLFPCIYQLSGKCREIKSREERNYTNVIGNVYISQTLTALGFTWYMPRFPIPALFSYPPYLVVCFV